MAERVAALIPAAGRGERLGRGPKAFVEVAGATLLERAVAAFRGAVDEIVVAVPPSAVEAATTQLGDARVVAGGATRQATVAALLAATAASWVAIHDAARPFLPADVRDAALDAARRSGAASVVRRVVDTLLEFETGAIVDRDRLRAVQTPQVFARHLVLRAHREASAHGAIATDDATLVRRLGVEVALVEGSPLLFKITTPDDLLLARAVAPIHDQRLRARQRDTDPAAAGSSPRGEGAA